MSDEAKRFFDIAQLVVGLLGIYGIIGALIGGARRYRHRETGTIIAFFWPVALPVDLTIRGALRLFRWARKRTRYLSWYRDAEDNLYW